MTDLRQYARDQPCMVRLPCCNYDPATTVLAHVRLVGVSGMSLKVDDLLGSWCCSNCHGYCDTHHDDATQAAFAQGVYRTQHALVKAGVVKW